MVVRPTDTNFHWISELYDANLDTAVVKKLIRIHFTKNGPSEKSWMTQPCGLPLSPDIHYYRRKWHRLQLSWLSQFNRPIAAISTSPSIMIKMEILMILKLISLILNWLLIKCLTLVLSLYVVIMISSNQF